KIRVGLAALHLGAATHGFAILQHPYHPIIFLELVILAGRGEGDRVSLGMEPSNGLMSSFDAASLLEEVAPIGAAVLLDERFSRRRGQARHQRLQHLIAIHSRVQLQSVTRDSVTGLGERILPAVDHLGRAVDEGSLNIEDEDLSLMTLRRVHLSGLSPFFWR